ncbi:MAG: NUDIX hydrolase [Chitinophagaceae bacterium]
MGYKIYFGDAPLYLTSVLDDAMLGIIHHDDGIYMDDFSRKGMKSMIHEMKNEEKHGGVYQYQNEEELFQEFKKNFNIVIAAGGIVQNERNEILMILRRGKWDFPKGKLDPGETIDQCAIREVQEECGLKIDRIVKPLNITYHVYDEFGKHILKETHWYIMKADSNQSISPQTEEDITDIQWVPMSSIQEKLTNTYAQIRDLSNLILSE